MLPIDKQIKSLLLIVIKNWWSFYNVGMIIISEVSKVNFWNELLIAESLCYYNQQISSQNIKLKYLFTKKT